MRFGRTRAPVTAAGGLMVCMPLRGRFLGCIYICLVVKEKHAAFFFLWEVGKLLKKPEKTWWDDRESFSETT